MTDSVASDRREIRELIENWAIWRDARDWDRFRTVWHEDGEMMATWWQGPYEEFIRVSQEGWDRGVRILHFLGGTTIDVNRDHAIAQTKMTITQRVEVHEVLCDVVCTGRFYDFLARRDERWGLVLRQPIYEIDRLTPVSPAPGPALDVELLARFPGATATSRMCRRSSATRSSATCPASTAPSSSGCTSRARSGSRANGWPLAAAWPPRTNPFAPSPGLRGLATATRAVQIPPAGKLTQRICTSRPERGTSCASHAEPEP